MEKEIGTSTCGGAPEWMCQAGFISRVFSSCAGYFSTKVR